jgi:cytochrome c553
MTRLFRNLLLCGAFITAAVLALGEVLLPDTARISKSAAAQKPGARRAAVKRWGAAVAGVLVAAAAGGFLFAASGIMPIKASSGHWEITAWVLNFAMRRSVVTHALAIAAPPLGDQALVLKGASHYEIGCRPCHGSPDLDQQPRIALRMTPQPPNLSREVVKWSPEQLFYIVKHGVKFTGMPAWPAQKRDDEIWAVVAFLLKLPTLSAADYKRLAGGRPPGADFDAPMHDLVGAEQVPAAIRESCGRCHGADGSGRGSGAFPKLAGQKPQYLIAAMQAYALGRRSSGIMEPIAVGLPRQTSAQMARFYATLDVQGGAAKRLRADPRIEEFDQPPLLQSEEIITSAGAASLNARPETRPALTSPGSGIERGRAIALSGIPNQRVPACADCHGPSTSARNPNYPTLAGQYAEYLALQLSLFKKQARGGSAYAHLMRPVAAGLTPAQMADVARYYESLGK